jgi:peptidyl-prolyl cis-trans isomerase B (cyclophilin B)
MESCARLRVWSTTLLPWLAALAGILTSGCGHQGSVAEGTNSTGNGETSQASAPAETLSTAAGSQAGEAEARLRQSFAEATLAEPPEGSDRPPDLTMTNKSVGKLYTDVVKRWDTVQLVAANGHRINYRAVLDTELGDITIALRPEVAPNHVRNFVTLALAGYYDGLVFERTIHEEVEGRTDAKVEIIEAGCPLGTGEAGCGSIGYWLKPEFSSQALHEEGTVGASHGEAADSAACKFYINLSKAPFMDGNYTVFGKVTQGLDVARRILALPVRNDPEYPEGDRPVKPVVIRKVTIISEDVAGDSAP